MELRSRTDGPPGLPGRFAGLLSGRHPAAVFFAALFTAFAVLALISVLAGLLVTDVLLTERSIATADRDVVDELVSERTSFLTDLSAAGSFIGGAPLLPILAGLVALVAAVKRHWLVAGFAVFALAVESATYRVTSMLVPRERPDVKRLEDLPADASFPSGHTAASIAVYVGFVLLLVSRLRSRGARFAVVGAALLVPAIVALSRMYRGMHHPLDVAGGVLVGFGALLVLLFACRAASWAAQAHRAPASTRADRSPRHAHPVA